jgi:hypothetical protein
MRLSSAKRQRVIEAVEDAPWGDIAGSLETVEIGLRRALDATADDFERWGREGTVRGERDEFSIESAEVEAMSADEKLTSPDCCAQLL